MACLRCQLAPVMADGHGLPHTLLPMGLDLQSRNDPEYPLPTPRMFGVTGPPSTPPKGFAPPRICGLCGVVYYPKDITHG